MKRGIEPSAPSSRMGVQRRIGVGTQVEARDRFCGSWSRGFEIEAATEHGYILRRLSDRYVLPIEFDADAVCRSR
jgi:hypothetical protein